MQHVVVFHDESKWAAVPANNGGNGPTWQWGNEILVGFTVGRFEPAESGHQCSYDEPFESWLARSTDGAETWHVWKPNGYAGEPGAVRDHPGTLDFSGPGFTMRIEGAGYHGNSGARWFASSDKGQSWGGPYGFGDLLNHPELEGKEFTGRSAYLSNDSGRMFLFLSVREANPAEPLDVRLKEKTFLAQTTNHGRHFEFVSWVVPWDDPHRAAMPAPVRISSSTIIAAIRRRSGLGNWIDCFGSEDDGRTWSFRSKIADTTATNQFNGNPPALVLMADQRLCCVFGNRTVCQIIAKYSDDEGRAWGPDHVLRDDFQSANGWPDLGYPRLFQRPDGKLAAVYFYCTLQRPQTHIEATIF